MKDTKSKNNAPASPLRRKTIKTLAVGVGALAGSTVLPEKWVTPIIQGIVLPAHAQTSAFQLAFCNGRVDLQLVSGHSGTSSMTIRATGCLSPAQANVTLNLTLAGYAQAVITDTEQNEDNGFLAAVSDALVPLAHAAQSPMCTVDLTVTTDSTGSFEAQFTLSCGPGIVQVELTARTSGPANQRAGWLDIPACNPCGQVTSPSTQAGCDPNRRTFTTSTSIRFGKTAAGPWNKVQKYSAGEEIWVNNLDVASVEVLSHGCSDPSDVLFAGDFPVTFGIHKYGILGPTQVDTVDEWTEAKSQRNMSKRSGGTKAMTPDTRTGAGTYR